MPSDARIEVVCEDRAHEAFVKALLEVLGVDRRRIYPRIAPRGRGAASAWVIQQHSQQRDRANQVREQQRRLGFVTIIDGDDRGCAGRLAELDAAAGSSRPRDARVAILVPTWSVETWVLWLGCFAVDESASLKEILSPPELISKVRDVVKSWNQPKPGEAAKVPSLTAARAELRRLPI